MKKSIALILGISFLSLSSLNCLAASGSRGGFAVGGFTPAIINTEADSSNRAEWMKRLSKEPTSPKTTSKKVIKFKAGSALSKKVKSMLIDKGIPLQARKSPIKKQEMHIILINSKDKLPSTVQIRSKASGSRGGFAVGGFSPS